MKAISTALKNHLALPATTIAFCWKVTLKNGTVYGFTDHDKSITYDGVTYAANVGFTASAIDTSSGLSTSNLEVVGFLDSSRLSLNRINAGDWDRAYFELFIVNYNNLSMGKMTLLCGYVGNITVEGPMKYTLELRGISSKLDVDIVEKCSPYCRYTLGDSRCKATGLSAIPKTQICQVKYVSSRLIFYYDTDYGQANGYYTYGKVTWLSGLNKGAVMEVSHDWLDASGHYWIRLFEEMGRDITVGDSFQLFVGCDKLFNTCKDKFGNHINFGGEPAVPGPDRSFGWGAA